MFFVAHVYNSDSSSAEIFSSRVVEADSDEEAGKQVAERFQRGSKIRVAVHEVTVVEAVDRMVPERGSRLLHSAKG